MKRWFVVIVVAVGGLTSALAQTPQGVGETAAPSSVGSAGGDTESSDAGWLREAFGWRSADGATRLRLAAAAHLDARLFFADSVAPDSFDIRRARFDVQGTLHDYMQLRIQAAMEGSPYIRNAWLDIRFAGSNHLRLGQMKVPFSTSWLTRDNQVNFLERGTSTPLYPFFDRGAMLWGELASGRATYALGLFNGAGVDVDGSSGDIDDHKDAAVRLFAGPIGGGMAQTEVHDGWYLAVSGTYGAQSVPTARFEQRGLRTAGYESKTWRWRTEQLLGSNGRTSDVIAGEIGARRRTGAELHWLSGPLTVSFEWVDLHWDDIEVTHELWVGSRRALSKQVLHVNGSVHSVSLWLSYFLTGEEKQITPFGWRQPVPDRSWTPGHGGGAWELLARMSATSTDEDLFRGVRVAGYTADELEGIALPVAEGESVRAAVLQGASKVYEATVGVSWTLNPNLRLQVNVTTVWADDFVPGAGGIVSGAGSNLADPMAKNLLVERETSLALRCIFRL